MTWVVIIIWYLVWYLALGWLGLLVAFTLQMLLGLVTLLIAITANR